MAEAKRYVGIDVAKAQLDVALGPNGERFAVANDERGISALLSRLRKMRRGTASTSYLSLTTIMMYALVQ